MERAIEARKHEWHPKPAIAIETVAQLFKHNAQDLGMISNTDKSGDSVELGLWATKYAQMFPDLTR